MMNANAKQLHFVVWGIGPSASRMLRDADAADSVAIAIATDRAETHLENPATVDWLAGHGDTWCVTVETDCDTIDSETRYDRATLGYALIRPKVVKAIEKAAAVGADFRELVSVAERSR